MESGNVAEEASRKRKRLEREKKMLSTKHKRARTAEEDGGPPNSTSSPVQQGKSQHTAVNTVASASVEKQTVGDSQDMRSGKQERSRRRMKERTKKKRDPTAVKQPTPQKVKAAWTVTRPTGGRFLRHDPVFSIDERYVFAADARELHIMSTADSLIDASLPAPEGSSITGLALSAVKPEHLYIALSSGSAQCWDWTTRSLVGEPISDRGSVVELAVHSVADRDIIYSVSASEGEWRIFRNEQQIYTSSQRLQNLQIQDDYVLAASRNKLVIGRPDKLQTDEAKALGYRFVEIPITDNITCLASRVYTPAVTTTKAKSKQSAKGSLTVAVGTASGEIYVYEDMSSILSASAKGDAASLATPRILHWHREAVEAIKWSHDGTYLISGGRETVLVIWQMATGKKQYLPHLTAEIENLTISPSGSSYGVQLADNSVMVLSTSELKPIANFAGLQASYAASDLQGFSQRSSTVIAAAIHPTRKDELLLAVPPSSLRSAKSSQPQPAPFLQTYDIASSRHVSRQALTRNIITDFNRGPEGNKIREPNISLIQPSHDGEWLATVEEWQPPSSDNAFLAASEQVNDEEGSARREVYLKIWRWNEERKLWALVIRIDSPHPIAEGKIPGRVCSLVADPAEVGFATIGEDSCVRIWKPKTKLSNGLVVRGSSADGTVGWGCRHSIQLEHDSEIVESTAQQSPMSLPTAACVAYSDDGSVLAASQVFEGNATLPPVHFIQAGDGQIAQSRSGLYTGTLSALSFMGRHLIVLSTSSLSVWDIVTETFQYGTQIGKEEQSSLTSKHARTLAIDHQDKTFAVATSWKHAATRIEIHNLEGSKPVFTHDTPQLVSALLTVSGRKGYVGLTSEAEIFQIVPGSAVAIPRTHKTNEAAAVPLGIQAPGEDEGMDVDGDSDVEGAESMLVDSLDDIDSDRPVVRPEQLASIFDTEQTAFMPVKAMFEAVVGLYGRKPRAEPVA